MLLTTATLEDYEDIVVFLNDIHNVHSINAPNYYKNISNFYSIEQFKEDLINKNKILLLAKLDEKNVGFCMSEIKISPENSIQKSRKILWIDALYTKINYRNQGIAYKMLENTINLAKGDTNYIELMVWSFNEESIKLYSKFGMKARAFIMSKDIY